MVKKQEAAWTFLTDLSAMRVARKRLLTLAEEQPEVVLEYLKGLSADQLENSEFSDLYRKLGQIAWKAVTGFDQL